VEPSGTSGSLGRPRGRRKESEWPVLARRRSTRPSLGPRAIISRPVKENKAARRRKGREAARMQSRVDGRAEPRYRYRTAALPSSRALVFVLHCSRNIGARYSPRSARAAGPDVGARLGQRRPLPANYPRRAASADGSRGWNRAHTVLPSPINVFLDERIGPTRGWPTTRESLAPRETDASLWDI
jgi:hypothetical protein